MNYYKIGKAAELIGVTPSTLRRWEKTGEFVPTAITEKGTRLYSDVDIINYQNGSKRNQNAEPPKRMTVGYYRIPLPEINQSYDYETILKQYLDEHKYNYIIMADTGCDLQSDTVKQLITNVTSNKIERIVILNRYHLSITHFDMIKTLCETFNVKIKIINNDTDNNYVIADFVSTLKTYNQLLHNRFTELIKVLAKEIKTKETKNGKS